MLRIIAGERRGRILKTVEGSSTRPTSDRIKESLFNILLSKLPGSDILDLFSGTGNLGLEAMSRGGESVVFVEKDKRALTVLRDNCKALDYMDYIEILPVDVTRGLHQLFLKNRSFDIVFMDPPYNRDLEAPTIALLHEYQLVKDDGVVVVEHLMEDEQPDRLNGFVRYDMRDYGNTGISFYRKDTAHEDSSLPGEL